MAFPVNPANGNLTIINNVVYVYNSEKGTWSKISSGQPQLAQYTDINATGTANIGNVITSQGVYWANGDAYYAASGGGSTTAGGIGTSIQFNDAGVLNGNTNFTYNKTTSAVTLVGNLYTANLIASGAGGQIKGYLTGAIGANTANTGAFTDLTASGNLTVTGNLTVNGTQTVVNSTIVTVNDLNLILANNAATSSAADGAGITVNGPSPAATIVYTHTTSSWNLNKAVIGQSFTSLSGGQLIGYMTGPIGANTANTGVFTSVTTTSGGQLSGYHTGPVGANTANTGAFTTLTSSGQTGLGNTAVTGLYTTNGLFWANGTAFSSGAGGTPQGSNTYVQFNDNGSFGGAAGITYNKTSNAVTIAGNVTAGNITTNGSGGQVIGYHTGAIGSNVPNTGIFTSVTTVGSGQIVGYFNGPIGAAVANTGSFSTLTVSSTTNLGSVSNVRITGGSNGYFLQTDGLGNLTWAMASGGGGSGSPGGSNAQVQFNDAGAFLGDAALTFNKGTKILTAANAINANGFNTLYGTQFVGYFNGAIGANTANSAVFSSINVTGATLFNNPTASSISASLIGNTGTDFNGATAELTGAVSVGSLATVSGGQVTGYFNGAIGANTPNVGTFTTLTSTSAYQGAVLGPFNGTVGATTPNTGAFTSVTTTGDVTIGGNLFVNGNSTIINANNISINDTIIYLANNNPANTYEIGLVGQFTSGSKQYTGIVRDHTNNNWTFFSNIATNPSGNLVTFDSTVNYDTIKVGNVQTVGGQLIGYHTGVIGANTANAGTFTTLTATSGYQGAMNGAHNGTVGATTPNTGRFTSITTTSAGQVIGYITGPVGANAANSGVFTTLTASNGYQGAVNGPFNGTIGVTVPNSIVATSLITISGGNIYGYLNGIIGANSANAGTFTTITATALNATSVNAGTIGNTGATLIGNVNGVVWGPINGTIGATIANTGTFTTLTATSGYQGAASGPLNGTLGATTPNTGAFTTITASGLTTLNGANAATVYAGTIGNTGAVLSGASISVTGTATSDKVLAGNVYVGDMVMWGGNNAITGAAISASSATYITGLTAANVQGVIGSVSSGSFPTLNQNTTGSASGGASGPLSGPFNGTVGATTPNTGKFTSVTTTSGGQVIGYISGPIGANTANTGVFTTLTATSGYQGTTSGAHNGTVGATNANTGVFTTLTATSGYQGAASGPLNGTLGATTPNSVVATSVTTTSGGQLIGYHTGPVGANTANTGVFTTLTATSGYQGATSGDHNGTVGATTPNTGAFTTVTASTSIVAGTIGIWAGNATITGVTLSGVSAGATGPLTGPLNGTVGATTPNTGVFTTLTATSGYQGAASGPINGTVGATTPNTGAFTTLTATSGYQGATSGAHNGTVGATTPNSVVATSVITTSGGQLTGYHTGPIGANTANTGAFTTISVNSASAGITNAGTNGVGDIGASGATFGTVWAKATSAQYADLAECYAADADYEPGTVVEFGGVYELTVAEENSASIAGIVSTNPAYLMNSAIEADFPVAVALTGRTQCKVHGPVKKGQMMVSAGNGYARASANPTIGTVIGKSLENFDEDIGIIEVAVGRF